MFPKVTQDELESVCGEKLWSLTHLVYSWRKLNGDSFTCQLFSLLMIADNVNKRKLIEAFPQAGLVWLDWYTSDSEEDFFKKHELED